MDLGDDVAEPGPADGAPRRRRRAPPEEAGGRNRPMRQTLFASWSSRAKLSTIPNSSLGAHHPALVEQLGGPLDRGRLGLQLGDRRLAAHSQAKANSYFDLKIPGEGG
jgi:hypothetical protein